MAVRRAQASNAREAPLFASGRQQRVYLVVVEPPLPSGTGRRRGVEHRQVGAREHALLHREVPAGIEARHLEPDS